MSRQNAWMLPALAIALLLAGSCEAKGQVDSIMNEQYEWCGISVKVTDGFRAEEADMIWKPNKTFEHKHSGRFINVMAKAMTGIAFCCTLRHCIGLSRKGKRTGLTDRWP